MRRSLGALLTDELNLNARPRGTGTSKTNYTNYRFDEEGERRLSRWMREHLRVAVHAVSNPPEVEAELIAVAHPPLNLTGWPNPERAEIKRAQAVRRRGAPTALTTVARLISAPEPPRGGSAAHPPCVAPASPWRGARRGGGIAPACPATPKRRENSPERA